MKYFYLGIKLTATGSLILNRLTLGHMGALSGIIDGVLLLAIWIK